MAMIAYAFLQHLRLADVGGGKKGISTGAPPTNAAGPTDAHTAGGKAADRLLESSARP
jgi:hypothetical protein